MKPIKILTILFTILLLVGCSNLSKPQTISSYLTWDARKAQLTALQSWELTGLASINSRQDSDIVRVDWHKYPTNYVVNVSSSIGIGGVKIMGDQQQVTLWHSVDKYVTAKTPEELMQKQLGWFLPLTNMQFWVVGLPASNLKYVAEFDHNNHLSRLQQQGWIIDYIAYARFGEVDLPTKIILRSEYLQIKVSVNNWSL